MVKKQGNILIYSIFTVMILLVLIYFSICISFLQVNVQYFKLKHDIYYIAQDMIIAFDKSKLSLYDYSVTNENLQYYFTSLLNQNYDKNNVNLEYISYNVKTNNLNVRIKVKVKPLLFSNYIKSREIILEENVKLKMMEVNNE